MSLGTKIFSTLSVVVLFALSIGWKAGYILPVAKFVVFISVCYLAVVSHRTKERFWLLFFIVSAIIFNPIFSFDFEYSVWRIIDALIAIGIAWFFRSYYDSYRKGWAFERFVASLFPKEAWVMEDWTKDKSHRLKRIVESDMNPDLTVRNISNGKRFAIECKFRSSFWTDSSGVTGISWKAHNHDFYKNYGEKENLPVKVIFGLGGNPKLPTRIFVVPLERLREYRGKIIPAQYLEKFEKNPKASIVLE